MTWVAVAIGGAAVIGAGASYAGASKQAKASKQAGNLNMDMFNTLNRQQQPFIQSGYGAMSKLNTLLGLSPRQQAANAPVMSAPSQAWRPTPGGGIEPIMQAGQPSQAPVRWNVPEANMPNLQLRRILSLRAQNGDRQAQAMLQRTA